MRDSRRAKPVIKYGSPIGTATRNPRRRHVHTHNVASRRGRGDLDAPPTAPVAEPTARRSAARPASARRGQPRREPRPGFSGYRRPDGRVGMRNHVLVVPTVICSSVVAERIAAAVAPIGAALPHLAGCGQLGPDMRVTHETLAAYCGHPNVGAVLVVALGCEQVVAQHLADAARAAGKPAEIVAIQSEGGTVRATAKGIAIAQALVAELATERARVVRHRRRWSCRSSAAAPTTRPGWPRTRRSAASPIGWSTLGGSAVLGEIAEIMGAEHLLAARATRPETAAQLHSGHHPRRDRSDARSASTSAARSRRPATSAAA